MGSKKNCESHELIQLSNWLKQLQSGLEQVGKIEKIWIGGGSARAILDHLYFNKSLTMRDLDVFAIANQEVTESFVEKIGSHLDSTSFGYFSRKDLRNRPRVPSDKPILTRNQYVAGYGLHWLRSNGEILDLSVYHTKEDLDLNGIFDIDTIMIPLDNDFSLADFAQKAKDLSYENLVREGYVYDRFNGYSKWLAKEITIVNWLDIEADPLLKVMRVVRTFFKLGRHHFTEEESASFQVLIQKAECLNPLQMTRSLLKVLEDEEALLECALLKKIGLFDKWLTQFNSLDFNAIDISNVPPLPYGRGERNALGKLDFLIQQLEDPHRLPAAYITMSPFDLDTLATWMYRELNGEMIIFENQKLNEERLRKICFSTVLSKEEKSTLFHEEWQGKWKARKGIISGIFNPVHLGHLEFFQEAITEMVLDDLYILVTEGEENSYEKPISWEERYAMLKLVEQELKGIRVIGPEYKKLITKGEHEAMHALVQEDSGAAWVRVLGSDSLQDYYKSGKRNQEVCSQILVIQRGEISSYVLDAPQHGKIYLKAHEPNEISHQKLHQAKNARKLARKGLNPSGFVPDYVAEYILNHKLYQEDSRLYCFTTNSSKFDTVKQVLPNCRQIPIDLPLINVISPEDAVKDKLQKAMGYEKYPLFVIEQFIKIKALSNHFIPLSDFTLLSLGVENIAHLIEISKNDEACLWTIVGYADEKNAIKLFQERIKGSFNPEELKKSFHFDPIRQFISSKKGSALDRVLQNLKEEKIGIITGVFNPIHYGHLQAIQKAQKELKLDRVIVIPTPATQHNESPLDWEIRMEMAKLAVSELNHVEVISEDFKSILVEGTGKALDDLINSHPNAIFWHIMGSDSFKHFKEKELLGTLSPKYNLAVLQRKSCPIEKIDHPHIRYLPNSETVQEEERASSVIRRRLDDGKKISHLVPKTVEAFIITHHLYQKNPLLAA